jgi:hypothetical protein
MSWRIQYAVDLSIILKIERVMISNSRLGFKIERGYTECRNHNKHPINVASLGKVRSHRVMGLVRRKGLGLQVNSMKMKNHSMNLLKNDLSITSNTKMTLFSIIAVYFAKMYQISKICNIN